MTGLPFAVMHTTSLASSFIFDSLPSATSLRIYLTLCASIFSPRAASVSGPFIAFSYISLGDVFVLPVGYAVERTTQYETSLLPIDEDKTVGRMKESLKNELQRRIGDGQIVSEEYSVSKTDAVMTVTLRAQCTENIAKEADYD